MQLFKVDTLAEVSYFNNLEVSNMHCSVCVAITRDNLDV